MTKVATKSVTALVVFAVMTLLIAPGVSAQWTDAGGGNIYHLGNVGVNTNPAGWGPAGGIPFVLYSATRPYFFIISACTGEGCDPSFAFSRGGSPVGYVGSVVSVNNGISGSAIGDLYFRSDNGQRILFSVDAGATAQMSITPTGASFIGTVTGTNIVAKYQDVAEWVPAAERLEPGTVVVLDPTHANQVMASEKPYDTRVAGVVSNKPGVLLGEESASKEKISTSGRVKVKVDASFGAIHIGDLLVSSPIAGAAMVSKPVEISNISMHRPGTIIGKALEPLDSGRGEILVLLSLQ